MLIQVRFYGYQMIIDLINKGVKKMKVKDYPEYGTIYEVGNAKIIALDREDMLSDSCTRL